MSDPLVRNLILTALSIAAGALAAGLGVLATQLAGTDEINWRPIMAAAIGPLVAGLLSMRLPRPEDASLAVQADHLKASNVPREHMVVMDAGTKREATAVTRHAEAALAGKAPEPVDHEVPKPPPAVETAWRPEGRG